ncbi:zinc-binding alcohol dehydrogenase family protein [Nocardioides mangrovicus]|uniref:Zinc-binding alcohol dehydrogenase family protein n=1 Tax=Nocardioides mangrovicus TaxID=2478913 RepID=A0A3L8P6K8_9ACTN|nr:zinc-binding alcohol dehydrogenase family protein [Nocardioides mangrovicus]RLV51040.1 zinc-binding alcohol dehydrogenase family protein [Nocardioides mangrovicus]
MRAAVITGPGAIPTCREFPEPEADQHRQVRSLVGAGLHQVVRSLAAGRHYGSHGVYPAGIGVDAVAQDADGGLVYTGWPAAPWGTVAERLATPLGLPLPADVDPLAVAAGLNPGMAGWVPLAARADELAAASSTLGTVVVLGATGAAGRMALQSAAALGASHVVAVGRDAARLEQLDGPDVTTVRLTDPESDAQAIAAALEGHAPSILLDFVWGPVAEAAFTALGRTGLAEDEADLTYVQIGSLAGATAALPSTLLRSRRIRVIGSGAGSISTEQLVATLPQLMALIADGTVSVSYRAFGLAEVDRAWQYEGPERVVIVP